MQIADRVWVVTGGGAGMGRQVVLAALSRGARVAAVDVSAEGLQETASLAGRGAGKQQRADCQHGQGNQHNSFARHRNPPRFPR